MQTDFRAIQAIAETTMGAHRISTVIEKAGCLFDNLEAHTITQLISDLLFYVGNPDCAQDLTKEDFVHLTGNSLSLVSMLTDLRGFYDDFVQHTKTVSNE